jgi:predicted nucleotidyltransferase
MDRRQQIIQWLKAAISENLCGFTYKAFIFGSQANKSALKRSDIDVGIISDEEIPAYKLSKINEAIENLPMLFKVDLVNFKEVDKKFSSIAMQNVEWL